MTSLTNNPKPIFSLRLRLAEGLNCSLTQSPGKFCSCSGMLDTGFSPENYLVAKVLSMCPLFQAQSPGYKSVIKANVFISKFIDQTFNIAQRLRARTPLEIYIDTSLVKNHWPRNLTQHFAPRKTGQLFNYETLHYGKIRASLIFNIIENSCAGQWSLPVRKVGVYTAFFC